jgi:hypothetical protein
LQGYQTKYVKMKKKFLFGLFFILVFLLLSGAVMYLWNIILPQIMPVNVINYWQALGLMALCRILFGSFHFGGRMGRYRGDGPPRSLKDKLINMDEADKSAFKEEWRRRCEKRRGGDV